MATGASEPIGWGIIGCGVIAPFHARAVAAVDEARLVAVVDEVPERAAKVGEEFGVEAMTDIDAFLARPDIQVVSLCVPSGLHGALGERAAAAGKHLLCEKPIEITLPGRRPPDRRLSRQRRQARRHLAAPLRAGNDPHQGGVGGRPLRQAPLRRRLHPVVPDAGLLRQRRLARHLGARRRRLPDEPGRPLHRPVAVGDGAGRARRRPRRHGRPSDRGRGYRAGDPPFRERRARA